MVALYATFRLKIPEIYDTAYVANDWLQHSSQLILKYMVGTCILLPHIAPSEAHN